MSFLDGLVGAMEDTNQYLVTSPNVDFIPQISLGFETVKLRSDGRFGVHDPVQWPQEFHPNYKWLVCILRRPQSSSDPTQIIWRNTTMQDFEVTYNKLALPWGLLRPSFLNPLAAVVNSLREECLGQLRSKGELAILSGHVNKMMEALKCLDFPATYRDVVRQVSTTQRYYLYTHAILDWNHHIALRRIQPGPHGLKTEYMGAFTTDPNVASTLYTIGVPVWFLRHPQQLSSSVVLCNLVGQTRPDYLRHDKGEFGHEFYVGRLGASHIEAIARFGREYLDIDHHPYAPPSKMTFTPAPSRQSKATQPAPQVFQTPRSIEKAGRSSNHHSPCAFRSFLRFRI